VCGLAFLGFPLHPAGRPTDERAQHLFELRLPMLFLQGTRDDLADLALLHPVIDRLGARATLCELEGADHSFHVPARSGRKDAEVRGALLDTLAQWIGEVAAPPL
jgi:predicted alpha/beta-hydrolase family hydrolase